MAGWSLSQESPQFWYEHMNFSAVELVKLHFPDIQSWQTPSERASYMMKGGVYLAISAVFFLIFMAFLLVREAPNIVGAPCGLCAVAMLMMALVSFYLLSRIEAASRKTGGGAINHRIKARPSWRTLREIQRA